MRKIILLASGALLAMNVAALAETTCVVGPHLATFRGKPNATIGEIVNSIPGDPTVVNPTLVAALTSALENNPSLASDAVDFARSATPAERDAIAAALADAEKYFEANGNPGSVALIRSAIPCADKPTLVAYNDDMGVKQTLASNQGPGPGVASAFMPYISTVGIGGGPTVPSPH